VGIVTTPKIVTTVGSTNYEEVVSTSKVSADVEEVFVI